MPGITRDMVLEGAQQRMTVSADEYGEGYGFIVSPPDAGDLSEARAIRLKHLRVAENAKIGIDDLLRGDAIDISKIDLSSAQIAMDEAKFHLVAKALSKGQGEEWTIGDAKRIKPEVFNRLWDVVDSMCGFSVEAEEAIKGFRKARKGKR